jgi:hypothetical protein
LNHWLTDDIIDTVPLLDGTRAHAYVRLLFEARIVDTPDARFAVSEQTAVAREDAKAREYTTPRLTRFGSVADLTEGRQMWGMRDGGSGMSRTN